MSEPSAGGLELTVLLAVSRLGEDAYGLSVRRDVSERMGREYSVGAIYTTLDRLLEKGLLSSRAAPPTPTRGGRSRRHFRLTGAGERAMREAHQRTASQWTGVFTPINPEHA